MRERRPEPDPLVTQLLAANGAVQVVDAEELEAQCRRLLRDPEERSRLVAAARSQIAVHRGAASRTARRLRDQRMISPCNQI